MMGSNCKDYIKECNRILDHNGILLIIESSKRWVDDNGSNRLENMIIDNGFTIKIITMLLIEKDIMIKKV